ncbi:MAG TPA: ORF6N domain-containing protein [Burkholderiales bacterium]|nr:ORF6N domain-containing protein [Burkholderiales bacterium]
MEPLIFRIRGHRVVLDAELARLYGVNTSRFNEAFKRNRYRFPADFAFQLSGLTPYFSRDNSSQFAMSSHRGRRCLPWAFTEHGALMAANILRTERAVQMSVFVVRAFVRLREHDSALRDVYQKLLPLLQPPADPPKRRIGFHTDGN